jgi:hypothetical protein
MMVPADLQQPAHPIIFVSQLKASIATAPQATSASAPAISINTSIKQSRKNNRRVGFRCSIGVINRQNGQYCFRGVIFAYFTVEV